MAIGVNYTIQDAKGERSTMTLWLPDGTSMADATAFAGSMALLITDLTTGAMVGIGLSISVALPGGVRDTPLANSDVEEGARFVFRTLNGFSTSTRIPTFSEAFILPNSNIVDQTATEVEAFINAMSAGTGVTVSPSDYRNEDIVTLNSALEAFQRSRR